MSYKYTQAASMILQSQAYLDSAKLLAKEGKSILKSTTVLCTQLSAELAIKSMIFLHNRTTYTSFRICHSLSRMTEHSDYIPHSIKVHAKDIEKLGRMDVYKTKEGFPDDLSIRARYPKYIDKRRDSKIVTTTTPIFAFQDVDINETIRFNWHYTWSISYLHIDYI